MAQPPMKWAVIGMLAISPMVPPGEPPMTRDSRRTASLPTGIQVGFGSPWPLLEDSRCPNSRLVLRWVLIELSRDCITSAMIAGQHAQPVGDVGQHPLVPHRVQQFLGAQGAGGEHDLRSGE